MKRKYDIAFSFAGENRQYVEKVAHILRGAGISVFYDKFEEADLWGKNLYTHLQSVYRDDAEFTVIFGSEHYAQKVWTSHERTSAQERALRENLEYILPARFDDTDIPGIPETVSYIDLRYKTPEEFSRIIAKKIGWQDTTGNLSIAPAITSIKEVQILTIREALEENPFANLSEVLICCPLCGSRRLKKSDSPDYRHDARDYDVVCKDCGWDYRNNYLQQYHRDEQSVEGVLKRSWREADY
jgi:hypothetical protein